jgi:polysaccharide export outer membrane protein
VRKYHIVADTAQILRYNAKSLASQHIPRGASFTGARAMTRRIPRPWDKREKSVSLPWFYGLIGAALLIIGQMPAVAQTIASQISAPSSASTTAPVTGAPATPEAYAYKLDVGDKIRLTVFGEMDLGGEYTVDGSGNVRLPLVGQVHASGLAIPEFESHVKMALEAGYLKNARVSAEVINYRPFYILGQINKPGEYPYVNGMNVLTAIALAGGYTYRASESSVYIRRKGSNQEQAVPADQTTKVLPGDIIRVRERFF